MTDLPPIPDEALAAADGYLSGRFDRYHPAFAQGVVERVWPHAYAAALRHAAEQVPAECPGDHHGVPCDLDPAVALLHRLADEASR